MIKYVDPKIKRLFPWGLFLALTALLLIASCSIGHAEEDKPVETSAASAPSYSNWSCDMLKMYLTTHTEAEAREEAIRMKLPKWIVHKAERCVK